MDNTTTYTATLRISSAGTPNSPMHIAYEWDPPLADVVKDFGEDNLPAAIKLMGIILDTSVFPYIMYNERYEALIDEDPDAEEALK